MVICLEASTALQILDAAGVKPDAIRSGIELEGTLKGDVRLEIPIGQRPEGYVVMETQDLSVMGRLERVDHAS